MRARKTSRKSSPRARTISLANDLYLVLSQGVKSRQDIANQLGNLRNEFFTAKQIDTLNSRIRRQREFFGWMPHNATIFGLFQNSE